MTEISEAALTKAREKLGVGAFAQDVQVFARYIQQVSDAAKSVCRTLDLAMPTKLAADEEKKALATFILPDPVDPLLIEARKAADEWLIAADDNTVQVIAWALRRGMDLAGGQP